MHLTMSIAHPYSRHQTLVPPTSRITCPLPMVVPGLLPPIPLGTQSSLSSRPANTTTTSMKVGSTNRNSWNLGDRYQRPSCIQTKTHCNSKNPPSAALPVPGSDGEPCQWLHRQGKQESHHWHHVAGDEDDTDVIDVFWRFQDNSCSRSTLSTSDPSATAPLVTPVWVIHNIAQCAVCTVR